MTAALTACLLPVRAALAQTPFIPDDWKYGKRQESSTLHYCCLLYTSDAADE